MTKQELRAWAVGRAEHYERQVEEAKAVGATGHEYGDRLAANAYRDVAQRLEASIREERWKAQTLSYCPVHGFRSPLANNTCPVGFNSGAEEPCGEVMRNEEVVPASQLAEIREALGSVLGTWRGGREADDYPDFTMALECARAVLDSGRLLRPRAAS